MKTTEDIKNIADVTHIKVFNDSAVALKYKNKNELSSEFSPVSNSSICQEFSQMVK